MMDMELLGFPHTGQISLVKHGDAFYRDNTLQGYIAKLKGAGHTKIMF